MGSRSLDEPHPNRLAPTHPMRARIFDAHATAMAAGEAAYLDPATGLLVLTAEALAARGDCCENDSRARRVTPPGAQTLGSGAFGLVGSRATVSAKLGECFSVGSSYPRRRWARECHRAALGARRERTR
jgi:hypothetical protein